MQTGDLSRPPALTLAPTDTLRLDGARRAAGRGDAETTAREFEKLFGVLLVRELRKAMPAGLFGDGAGADVYEGWFDEHLGSALSERDALGIAGIVKTALARAQAAREATAGLGDGAAQEASP